MGVHCEINLQKPINGGFSAGSNVMGTIKYATHNDTVFSKISISIKGSGKQIIRDNRNRKNQIRRIYRDHENYLHLNTVIHEDQHSQMAIPKGSYEVHFNFPLPENIPSTLHVRKRVLGHSIFCDIQYILRIKFERPGLFNFDKKFKKEITVVSGINPRLASVPTICGEQKTLTQLFSSKTRMINIKATVQSCIIVPGNKIEFEYEVCNDTNVTIKGVKTKLIEVYTFTTGTGKKFVSTESIPDTDSKTGTINPADVKKMNGEIIPPSDRISLDFSNMVSRDYFVLIKVIVPFPHRDAILKVPLQIGDSNVATGHQNLQLGVAEAPPSYWEVMAEDSKTSEDDDA